MRRYELCLILRPEVGDEGFQAKIGNIKQMIEKEGAVFVREDIWGLRQLAYQIKNSKKAYYAFLIYDILPENIKAIQHELQIDEDVLRSIIKQEKERKIPEPVAKETQEDEKSENIDEGDIDDAKEVNKSDHGESE